MKSDLQEPLSSHFSEAGAKEGGGPSKPFFNMTNQFSKLNPMTKFKLSVKKSNASEAESKEGVSGGEGSKNPLTSGEGSKNPLTSALQGIQNIGASLKKGGEEIGTADVEVAAAGAFDNHDETNAAADDLKERARNTSSKTKFVIL